MSFSSMQAYRGFVIDSPRRGELREIRDGALLVEDGIILDCGEYSRIRHLPEADGLIWQNSPSSLLLPGLIDLHTHLPQYPAVARQESALLPWLEKHIFPLEKDFTPAVAKKLAPVFFEHLARSGTTTAGIFTSISKESTEACFEAAAKSGMRVIMGKMMMDRGSYGSLAPEKILARSVTETRSLCETWHRFDKGRIDYAVSPRFAVTCTTELMTEAAKLAREFDCYIQTHLSENHEEIQTVKKLFPEHPDYTSVYAACGLLTPKTFLGHGIHLSPSELEKIKSTGAAIVHCPSSNLFLKSGIMPLDRWQDADIPLALGSDVAAGPELNLWRVLRSALESQVARSFYEEVRIPSLAELFHLVTQGAAEAIGKGDIIGTLSPGKEADFIVLDLKKLLPAAKRLSFQDDLSANDILSLLIHRADDAATIESFVRGRSVYRAFQGDLL
ncbi:MAG: guanine deaminase [Chthoniobacterales bacterium]